MTERLKTSAALQWVHAENPLDVVLPRRNFCRQQEEMKLKVQSVREYPAIPTMESGARTISKTSSVMIVKAGAKYSIKRKNTADAPMILIDFSRSNSYRRAKPAGLCIHRRTGAGSFFMRTSSIRSFDGATIAFLQIGWPHRLELNKCFAANRGQIFPP